ncbi:MAG: hypothetical protein JXR91_06870 [Deltaproteobacteria bacterium]|nr:hypothetical protein [Deltaproteobacteria bacterium]
MGNSKNHICVTCGSNAEVKFKNQWLCGTCLNPEPSREYLTLEREQINGQWGGVRVEMWNQM